MALFTVNSNNVFGKTVEEAGIYNVRVLPSTQLKTSSAGNAMVVMNYEVLDGKYAGGPIRYDNVVWQDGSQDERNLSIKRFNTIMVAAGVPDGTPLNTLNDFVAGMIGKELAVEVEWGEPNRNGDSYLSVRSYRKFMQDGSKPNGIRRPQSNSSNQDNRGGQANTGFNNAGQPQSNNYPQSNGNGAPTIDDDQLPF